MNAITKALTKPINVPHGEVLRIFNVGRRWMGALLQIGAVGLIGLWLGWIVSASFAIGSLKWSIPDGTIGHAWAGVFLLMYAVPVALVGFILKIGLKPLISLRVRLTFYGILILVGFAVTFFQNRP